MLVLIAVLMTKHFLFDFVLQSRWQLRHKGDYGHPGGLAHVGLHAVGSLAAVLIAAPPPEIGAAVLIGEGAVHYHLDWGRERLSRRTGWTYGDNWYWRLFGADQLLHGLTYVAMTWALVSAW